jgi:hypothetical protein
MSGTLTATFASSILSAIIIALLTAPTETSPLQATQTNITDTPQPDTTSSWYADLWEDTYGAVKGEFGKFTGAKCANEHACSLISQCDIPTGNTGYCKLEWWVPLAAAAISAASVLCGICSCVLCPCIFCYKLCC